MAEDEEDVDVEAVLKVPGEPDKRVVVRMPERARKKVRDED